MNILLAPEESSFTGCLLGLALGDALGAPIEGFPPGKYSPDCSKKLTYTDDTEMMINLARALVERDEVTGDEIARYFASSYNPSRGYGSGTLKVLSLVSSGVELDRAVRAVFPEGSFGNGAAMRVAPVGLRYYREAELLEQAIRESAIATHVHPVGIDGARIMAHSVAFVLKKMPIDDLPEYLLNRAVTTEFKEAIRKLRVAIDKNYKTEDVIRGLGNSVAAHRSVPAALYAFIKYGEDFISTVTFCLSLGGDTDTIASMAGALSGCLVGENELPVECLEKLESRQEISRLAREIYLKSLH